MREGMQAARDPAPVSAGSGAAFFVVAEQPVAQALYEPEVVRVCRSNGHSVWKTPSLSVRW